MASSADGSAGTTRAKRSDWFWNRPINRWWFVLGCALVNVFASGIYILYAVNIFFVDASAEFGWAKSMTATLVAVFFFAAGLALLMLGWAIGRYGIRKPSLISFAGYAATLLAVPFLPPGELIFIINFFLMGLFSGSACALPFAIAISGHFDSNRGLALGLGAAGAGFGSAITAGFSNELLELFGWRTGILIYSVIALTAIFISLAFLVRTPEATLARTSPATDGKGLWGAFREVLDREMAIIIGVLLLNALCAIGVVGNLVPLLGERGISTGAAAGLLTAVGMSSWGGRILIGWLLDRFFAPYVACGTFILGVFGTLVLIYGGSLPLAFVASAMIGVCMGAEQDLAMYLVGRYFPLSLYSKAVSISWLAWAWGGGIGSFIAGQSYNLTQSYELAFWIFGGLFALAAMLVMRLPAYRVQPRHGPAAAH